MTTARAVAEAFHAARAARLRTDVRFEGFDELRVHPETWVYCVASMHDQAHRPEWKGDDWHWMGMAITRNHTLPEGTALFCYKGDVLERATHLPHRTVVEREPDPGPQEQ